MRTRLPNAECRTRNAEYVARRAAFTLIEIIISAALMALILVSSYLCLTTAVADQKLIEPRLEVIQSARVALNLVAADLRSACVLSTNYDFLGVHGMIGEVEADHIYFGTHNFTPRHPREGDYCQESYFIDLDAESGQLGLFRRRNPLMAFDPLTGGSRELIAKGVLGFRLEFSDGVDWYDDWGTDKASAGGQTAQQAASNAAGLPEAVRITLLLATNPKAKATDSAEQAIADAPLVFQTVARLNLADAPQRGATSDSSSSGGGGSDNGNQPTTPPGGGPGGPGGGM